MQHWHQQQHRWHFEQAPSATSTRHHMVSISVIQNVAIALVVSAASIVQRTVTVIQPL
jgi:hypothetical protein